MKANFTRNKFIKLTANHDIGYMNRNINGSVLFHQLFRCLNLMQMNFISCFDTKQKYQNETLKQ